MFLKRSKEVKRSPKKSKEVKRTSNRWLFSKNVDGGAWDRARRAESDDSLRQGMIARARLDESERRQERYVEVHEVQAATDLSVAAELEVRATRAAEDKELDEWEAEVDVGLLELLAEELPEVSPTGGLAAAAASGRGGRVTAAALPCITNIINTTSKALVSLRRAGRTSPTTSTSPAR